MDEREKPNPERRLRLRDAYRAYFRSVRLGVRHSDVVREVAEACGVKRARAYQLIVAITEGPPEPLRAILEDDEICGLAEAGAWLVEELGGCPGGRA